MPPVSSPFLQAGLQGRKGSHREDAKVVYRGEGGGSMLKGKHIDQSFTPQFQSIMNHRGEKTYGYEIGYEINLYINFIAGERPAPACAYTLQRPHCPDPHTICVSPV